MSDINDMQFMGGTLEIPSGHWVDSVNLDCSEPYCIIFPKDKWDNNDAIKLMIPKNLAYYLRTHFCGSREYHDRVYEQGAHDARMTIKRALDITS